MLKSVRWLTQPSKHSLGYERLDALTMDNLAQAQFDDVRGRITCESVCCFAIGGSILHILRRASIAYCIRNTKVWRHVQVPPSKWVVLQVALGSIRLSGNPGAKYPDRVAVNIAASVPEIFHNIKHRTFFNAT